MITEGELAQARFMRRQLLKAGKTIAASRITVGHGTERITLDEYEDLAAQAQVEMAAENAWLVHAERSTMEDEAFEAWEAQHILQPDFGGPEGYGEVDDFSDVPVSSDAVEIDFEDPFECDCGKHCGNAGGLASHQKACPLFQQMMADGENILSHPADDPRHLTSDNFGFHVGP